MVDVTTGSSKLGIDVPELDRWFENDILYIAGSDFPSGLVFYVDEVSITLNVDNLVSRSPLEVPFSWLFVFEVDSVSYLE